MGKLLLVTLALGVFVLLIKITAILVAIVVALIFIVVGLRLIFLAFRSTYHFFSPRAKQAHKARLEEAALRKAMSDEDEQKRRRFEKIQFLKTKAKADEDEQKRISLEKIQFLETKAKAEADYLVWAEKKKTEALQLAENEKAEALHLKEQLEKQEIERQRFRDSDEQIAPYTYQIAQHGNESLAIRYGIANHESYRGNEAPRTTIKLQKVRKIKDGMYEVFLTDYRDRLAIVIIEPGTEYVKTFYPKDSSWFNKYAGLEETLKGNGSFSLKELATFHVEKTVGF